MAWWWRRKKNEKLLELAAEVRKSGIMDADDATWRWQRPHPNDEYKPPPKASERLRDELRAIRAELCVSNAKLDGICVELRKINEWLAGR